MPDETIEQAEVVLDAASKNVVTLTNEREAKLTAAKKTRDDAQATAAGAYDATVEATRVEYKAKLADARKQETQAKNALSDLLGRSAGRPKPQPAPAPTPRLPPASPGR